MNFEALNRYVLIAIGLLGLIFYLVAILAGASEMLLRMPKSKRRRKRSRTAARSQFRKYTGTS